MTCSVIIRQIIDKQFFCFCRMICRLPKDNTLLLRYLLAMLHGIQGNAHENQMTSFNLAVCIAPSMLWPPGAPASPEVEGEGAKRVREVGNGILPDVTVTQSAQAALKRFQSENYR